MRKPLSVLAALLVASAVPAAAELDRFIAELYPSVDTETIAGAGAEKRAEQTRLLHAQLKMNENAAATERALVVHVTAAEAAAIAAPNPFEQRYQVGIAKPVGATVDLAAAVVGDEKALPFGAWHENDGGVIWSGVVRSPGATGLRLHLTGFDLPRGVELYVYNEDGQAYGPYIKRGPAGDGELHTNTIFGDELRLQLRARTAGKRGAAGARFTIADLGWMGERFLAGGLHAGFSKSFCSFNASCVENANCASANLPSTVSAARSAIAHLLFPSGGGYYICTGGLVADSDTSTVVPYLITANHCISRSSEASGLETYFDYETPCNDSCATPYGGTPRNYTTLGATIAKTSSKSDYTLMRLAQTPGGTRAYLGWSAAPLINTGTVLHRLSHPQGAPLAYSQHQEYSPSGVCRSWPRGSWIYEDTLIGATEGGSSGSPVLAIVDGAAKLVGQLSGACGTNLGDKCDTDNNSTVDGAFAAYYGDVTSFLGSGTGGSCLEKGTKCTAGSQCCSGVCSGKGKNKTCG